MSQFLKSYSSVFSSENGKVTKDKTKELEFIVQNDKIDGTYKETNFGNEIINKNLSNLSKQQIKQIVEGNHNEYYIPDNIFTKALQQIQRPHN